MLPVPLAAAGYGVLLGLGFTTFVLSFAVWALAGASIALGDPALGLGMGLAFGAGRALPVIALAPFAGTERGGAVTAAMCERPAILRGLRRVDAVALAAVARRPGDASRRDRRGARRRASGRPPSRCSRAAPTTRRPPAGGSRGSGPPASRCCSAAAGTSPCPGSHPALGGGRIAWLDDGETVVADPATFRDRDRFSSPGAGVIALSETVLAWRARDPAGTDRLWALPLGGGEARLLLESPAPTEIGRPALLGGLVLCHVAGPGGQPAPRDRRRHRRPAAPAHRADRHAHEPVDRRRAAALRPRHRAPAGAAAGPGRAGPPDRRPRAAGLPVVRPARRRARARAPPAPPGLPRPPPAAAAALEPPASSRRCGARRSRATRPTSRACARSAAARARPTSSACPRCPEGRHLSSTHGRHTCAGARCSR